MKFTRMRAQVVRVAEHDLDHLGWDPRGGSLTDVKPMGTARKECEKKSQGGQPLWVEGLK